jgi:hypothetical protein
MTLYRTMAAGSLIALCLCLTFAHAQSAEPNPAQVIRRVVQNELNAERQDHSHWMFRLETLNKGRQKDVDNVIETTEGDLKWPILINGREPTARERQQADAQLARNPDAARKALKDKDQDATKSQQMLKMLPDAFTYRFGDHRGDLTQLLFKPNPGFRPKTREAEVFHAMEGSIWVDEKQNRLAEISGHLTQPVKFGGGLLGHLDQGGTFDVKQEQVAPGYWELTMLNVEMKGKALLFKTISVHQKYSRSEFQRVPNDITSLQAATMLKQHAASEQVSRR